MNAQHVSQLQDCRDELSGPTDIIFNPETGLASDYLNHYNQAIMLLDVLPHCHECVIDLFCWTPVSYRDHFANSQLKNRHAAIVAYDNAASEPRRCLEELVDIMTALLQSVCAALQSNLPPSEATHLAQEAAANLKPLIARAGAVINGTADTDPLAAIAPQAVIDRLMIR
jgi:hypothetical protein